MTWSTTAAAITALRSLIKDNPTDKLCSMKQVIGQPGDSNVYFKTFEARRLTDFTTSPAVFPLGVFKDNVQLNPSDIAQDDPESGTFKLAVAPTNREGIRATYYYQWFEDTELASFLENASTWLGFNTTYINIPDGLNSAALRFAAQEAYLAAAMKYSTRAAEIYKLEDAPNEDILKAMEAFKDMAGAFMDSAKSLRDDYYTRQGQAGAPLFGFALGRVTDPTPRR